MLAYPVSCVQTISDGSIDNETLSAIIEIFYDISITALCTNSVEVTLGKVYCIVSYCLGCMHVVCGKSCKNVCTLVAHHGVRMMISQLKSRQERDYRSERIVALGVDA